MRHIAIMLLFSISLHSQVTVMQGYSDTGAPPIKIEAGQSLLTMSPGYFINEPRYQFYRKLHEFSQEGDFMGHEQQILDEFDRFIKESSEISEQLSLNSIKISDASQGFKIGYSEKIKELESQVSIMSKNNSDLKEQLNILENKKSKKGKWIIPSSIGVIAGTFATLLLK